MDVVVANIPWSLSNVLRSSVSHHMAGNIMSQVEVTGRFDPAGLESGGYRSSGVSLFFGNGQPVNAKWALYGWEG